MALEVLFAGSIVSLSDSEYDGSFPPRRPIVLTLSEFRSVCRLTLEGVIGQNRVHPKLDITRQDDGAVTITSPWAMQKFCSLEWDDFRTRVEANGWDDYV